MAAATCCGPVPGLGHNREAAGGPAQTPGRNRHVRPLLAFAAQPVTDGDADRAAHHRAAPQSALGPAEIGWLLGLHPSTVHRVLFRFGLARLAWPDRGTGRVIRRCEHDRPGSVVHIDVKKLGKIPDGGGWRIHGPQTGSRNSRAITPIRKDGHAVIGHHYLHTALDDYSRMTYTEILPNEQQHTAAEFWTRANAYFTRPGITVERVLTDNGGKVTLAIPGDTGVVLPGRWMLFAMSAAGVPSISAPISIGLGQ